MKHNTKAAQQFSERLNASLSQQSLPVFPKEQSDLLFAYDTDLSRIDVQIRQLSRFYRQKIGLEKTIDLMQNFMDYTQPVSIECDDEPEGVRLIIDLQHTVHALEKLVTVSHIQFLVIIKERIKEQILIRQTGLEIIRDNKVWAFNSLSWYVRGDLFFHQTNRQISEFGRDAIKIIGSKLTDDVQDYIVCALKFNTRFDSMEDALCDWDAPETVALFESRMWLYLVLNCIRKVNVKDLIPSAAQLTEAEKQRQPARVQHAFENNSDSLWELIKKMDINCLLPNGYTSLMMAAESGDLALVKTLVEAGANIEINNPDKGKVIHIAARKKHEQIMAYLYTQGARSKELHRVDGYSPAQLAKLDQKLLTFIKAGDCNAIRWLLDDLQVPLTAISWHGTPLAFACESGSEAVTDMLINEYHAYKQYDAKQWGYCLATAINNSHFTIANQLLAVADKEADDKRAFEIPVTEIFWVIVETGNPEQASYILDHFKINLNMKNKDNQTPLIIAVKNARKLMVSFLLNWQGKSSAIESISWVDNHYRCAIDYGFGHTKTAKMLLEKGSVKANYYWHEPIENSTKKGLLSSITTFFNSAETIKSCLFEKTIEMLLTSLKTTTNSIEKESLKLDDENFEKIQLIIEAITPIINSTTLNKHNRAFTLSNPRDVLCDIHALIKCLKEVKGILEKSTLIDDQHNRLLDLREIPPQFKSLLTTKPAPDCLLDTDINASQQPYFEAIFKILYEALGGARRVYTYQLRTNYGAGWIKIDAAVIDFIQKALFAELIINGQEHSIVINAESESEEDLDIPDDIESNKSQDLTPELLTEDPSRCLQM